MRIDKYLWSVRLFKTRSLAADACKCGKVQVGGTNIKPSRTVAEGDVFEVRKVPVIYKYRVKKLLPSRVGAKLVSEYLQDLTPQEELDKLDLQKGVIHAVRDRGTGRPTKKERRLIDKMTGQSWE